VIRNQSVLSHTFEGGVPLQLIGANDTVNAESGHLEKLVSENGERFLDIAWPIFGGNAGVLRLGLSETPYRAEANRLWWQMNLITLAVLLLALLTSLWFIHRLTRPLVQDNRLTNAYNKMLGLYFENFVTTKNSMTGKAYHPHADFIPGPADCAGNRIKDREAGFDMTLITYKFITQTKSRTGGNYWLNAVYPENYVEISSHDARRLGLKYGDRVRILSASNADGDWDLGNGTRIPMQGKFKVLEGIRPRGGRFLPRPWTLGPGRRVF